MTPKKQVYCTSQETFTLQTINVLLVHEKSGCLGHFRSLIDICGTGAR